MSSAIPETVQGAFRYADDVLSGRVPAGRLVRQAAKRFQSDYALSVSDDWQWDFDVTLADRAISFVSLLSNIKGPLAGRPLELMDWQKFVVANLFGFIDRITRARRFRQGVIFVARGNGKTSMAAPLALYCTFMEGEGGAEGYAAAVTRDQARILFDTAREMVRRSPDLRQQFGVDPGANSIYQKSTASKLVPISSDAKALDGLNVAIAVCDEIGSHKTSEVYDVLLTAMGKRAQPLLLCISTATGNSSGIGKQLWDYSTRVLDGAQQDDQLFSLIYTVDEHDDHWDEATWIKANPSWGFAVQPDAIRAIMRQARNNPSQEAAAKTRHLNIWVGADEALFSMRAWIDNTDTSLSLEQFEGKQCYLSLDLASKTDLAALNILFPTRDDDGHLTYVTFSRSYLNSEAVMEARNASYPGWVEANWITVTSGNETDFSVIENDIRDYCRIFDVKQVGYDPWGSSYISQRLMAEGIPMIEFRALTQNFSEPCKELDAAIRAGRIKHQGDQVLSWALGNVVGHFDARNNVYPRKQRPEQKIDPAISLIMNIGLALRDFSEEMIYTRRSVLFV